MIKIADFGLARKIDTLARPLDENGPVVTLWYRAPELLLGAKHYDEAIDAWAAGAIFGELATLAPLFRGVEAPGAGARRDMYDHSQLEKIFATLGVPNGHQKPEKDTEKDDDASWPDAALYPFGRAVRDGLRRAARVGFRCLAEDPNHASLLNLVRALPLRPAAKAQRRGRADAPVFRGNARAVAQRIRRGRGNAGDVPAADDKNKKRRGRARGGGEATRPAPRGAAGAAALNAVRSDGDRGDRETRQL